MIPAGINVPHVELMADKSYLILSIVLQLTVLVAFETETSETEKEAVKRQRGGKRLQGLQVTCAGTHWW